MPLSPRLRKKKNPFVTMRTKGFRGTTSVHRLLTTERCTQLPDLHQASAVTGLPVPLYSQLRTWSRFLQQPHLATFCGGRLRRAFSLWPFHLCQRASRVLFLAYMALFSFADYIGLTRHVKRLIVRTGAPTNIDDSPILAENTCQATGLPYAISPSPPGRICPFLASGTATCCLAVVASHRERAGECSGIASRYWCCSN